MSRIFISYAREDGAPLAQELANRLRAQEHKVFLDVESIRGGAQWKKELKKYVNWSDILVVLVTPCSNESDYVYEEVNQAEKQGKKLIPLQINNTPLPVHLRGTWHAINVHNHDLSNALLEIEKTVKQLPRIRIRIPVGLWRIGLVAAGVALGLGASALLSANSGRVTSDVTLCSSRSPIARSAHIMSPDHCAAHLPKEEIIAITGTYDESVSDQKLWVLVHNRGNYWPQVSCRADGIGTVEKRGGTWDSIFRLGGADQFDVVLVSTAPDSAVETQFMDWARTGCATDNYPGIPVAQLADGLTELDSITVMAR
jgi:hypothetical protein